MLVIEDDESLRLLLLNALERFNYRVLMSANPTEALAAWQSHRGVIGAVVSDCDLRSDRNGISLLHEFGGEKPALVMVMASGSLTPKVIDTLHRTTRIQCLTKPFLLAELLRLLRQGLDATPPVRPGPGT